MPLVRAFYYMQIVACAMLARMENALKFLKLIQATRSQPQYGYVPSGIKKSELSDLAQHHYLVTLTAWYLARLVKAAGGVVDLERVLEICLLHDLGELFGGDIARPYAIANPAANKLAKAFEQENQRYLTSIIGDANHVKELFQEGNFPESTEAVVAKIADYMEVTHYKHYLRVMTKGDVKMVVLSMNRMISGLTDQKSKKFLTKFVKDWSSLLRKDDGSELFEADKLKA